MLFSYLDFWNQPLSRINKRYEKDDLQLKAHILAMIPDAYDQILTTLKKVESGILIFHRWKGDPNIRQ
jgi:hypothetical protein